MYYLVDAGFCTVQRSHAYNILQTQIVSEIEALGSSLEIVMPSKVFLPGGLLGD